MSRSIVSDRERVAVAALEGIAARGIVARTNTPVSQGIPDPYQCPICQHRQHSDGPCANRDCLTRVATVALDDLRRIA